MFIGITRISLAMFELTNLDYFVPINGYIKVHKICLNMVITKVCNIPQERKLYCWFRLP